MAHFCVRSYDVRNLKLSDAKFPRATKIAAITECLEAADHVVDWFLETDLLDREGLRFASDCSMIMPALACMFVLQSLQILQAWGHGIPSPLARVERVGEMAELLKGIGCDPHHGVNRYGHFIQNVVVSLQKNWRQTDHFGRTNSPNEGRTPTRPLPADLLEDSNIEVDFSAFSDFDFDNIYTFASLWDMASTETDR
jgi:hypothetical protein